MARAQQASPPVREQPGTYKKNRFSHVQNTKYGMGDSYGTGIKAKIGTMRDNSVGMVKVSEKELKKPPKSLA